MRATTLHARDSESNRPESPVFALLRETVGVDPRALACFRIALGADLLYEIVGRSVSLTAHFSDAGVLPRDSFSPFWRIVPSLFFLSGDVRVQALLCLVAAVAALMLIAGYRTTGATVASWVLYLGMVDRNPLINSGGDHLLRYLLFWSMFVPLGAVASIDERSKERRGAVTPRDRRALIVTGGVAGLKLQIVSVYLFAGLHKLQAPAWHSGVAVTRALQMYTRSTPFGLWLLAFPNALAFATHIIPWLQVIGAVLLLVPFRSGLPSTLIVSGFTIFQLMLAFTIVLGNFQQVCILMMIPLLPPWFWDRWTNGTTASRSISESISRQSPTKGARAVQGVVGVIAAYVFAMNAGQYVAEQIAPGHATLPGRPERIGSVLGLDQSWRLFLLPEIDRQFGWIVARGTLANGARIDLLSNRPESEWNIPPRFSPMRFFDWRERLYLNSLIRFSPDDPRMKAVRPIRLFGLERSPPRVEPLTRARCHFHGGCAPAERGAARCPSVTPVERERI